MLTQEVRDIAQKIGQFYLQKYDNDYQLAEQELIRLQITKIEVEPEMVRITLARPGILIGRRGINIENLTKFLGVKVFIIEDQDPIYSWLIPYKDEPEKKLPSSL